MCSVGRFQGDALPYHFANQKFAKAGSQVQKARGEEKEAIQEVPRLLLKVGP